jgi:hypothetical protein
MTLFVPRLAGYFPLCRVNRKTYPGKFGNDNRHQSQEIDGEIGQVVMGVVGAQEEEHNGHAEQELLGGGVLVAVVHLLPHVEVVVGAGVEFKGHAAHVVEHQVRAKHVADVGQGPGDLLGHAWDDVKENLEGDDQDEVDGPGS